MRRRQHKLPSNRQAPHGFTIIEVLIVLAIAGVILLIIFLAVPAANRAARNHTRRLAVDATAAQLNEYFASHEHYPQTPTSDDRTAFSDALKAHGETSIMDKIRYADILTGSHEYPFTLADASSALDELSIQQGHRCNRTAGIGAGDTDYPLITAGNNDKDYYTYAVWTPIELANSKVAIYCIDNAN